ncbi:hypothetical protein SAMN05421769_3872 [Chryseobacterium scophthalmum]|uniref:Uncharacterized protein n=1 Tax=Chryseobacterium scophthalmum TaxID=59733 RepID=A0A1N6IX83_9FLAO|nr:hypothetical protein SAMN05421769_3872 [Chryseobacterium scophthalmum]
MSKFSTFLLNLRSSINFGIIKEPIFKIFDRLSSYLFSIGNILFLMKINIRRYTEKSNDRFKLHWYSISF